VQLSINPFGRLTEATQRESVGSKDNDILTVRKWIRANVVLHANARDLTRSLGERFFPLPMQMHLNDSLDIHPSVTFSHLQAQTISLY